MNLLIVGRNNTVLEHLPSTFLLIDDGPLIDALELPARRKVSRFDVAKHSFNPLRNINYLRAKQFLNVLDAVFPEGENTLTKKASNFILLNALLESPKRLDKLIGPKRNDSAHMDAYQKIQTLLLSPVLRSVLCEPTNFSLNGIVLARLNRAELGDFDCFVLANLLIASYKGHVVIPDFGFYAHKGHTELIRQNRLIAGVTHLAQVPELKNDLLLMDIVAKHCTEEDAKTIAPYCGYSPSITGYSEFIAQSIK